MSTLETLQSIFAAEFRVKTARLDRETKLDELGVDSLDMLELLFKIEDRFQLKIRDDMPRSLVTVGDLADYVDGLLARPDTAPVTQAGTAAPLARPVPASPAE